jgi:hypothetical protein
MPVRDDPTVTLGGTNGTVSLPKAVLEDRCQASASVSRHDPQRNRRHGAALVTSCLPGADVDLAPPLLA